MAGFDLSILDDIGVGEVGKLVFDAVAETTFKATGETVENFGDWMIGLSTGNMVGLIGELIGTPSKIGEWGDIFCEEILDSILKQAGLNAADRGQIKKSLNIAFDANFVTKAIGCVVSTLSVLLSYTKGVSSGLQTHVVRSLNTTMLPNTGGPNDAIRNAFIMTPGIDAEKLRKELGIDNEWWAAMLRAAETRAGLGELGELFRRGDLAQAQFKEQAKKLGVQDEEQFNLIQAAASRVSSVGDIAGMIRTGRFDPNASRALLTQLGYKSDHADKVFDGLLPSHTTEDIIRLWNMNEITEATAKAWAKNRGWQPADFKARTELARSLPPVGELRNALYRGHIDEKRFDEYLSHMGLFPSEAEVIKANSEQLYSPSDLIRFSVREVFTPAIANRFGLNDDFPEAAVAAGERIGLTEDTLRLYWASHWQLPAPGQGFEMFHRGIIGEADLKLLMRALDVMPFWQDKMIALSFNVLPRRVVNSTWRLGQITDAQFLDHYKQLGFNPVDAQRVLAGEIERREIPEREATKADLIAAFVVGEASFGATTDALAELGFVPDAVNIIMRSAVVRRDLFKRAGDGAIDPEPDTTAPAAIRNDILKAYREDLISRDAATTLLSEFGMHEADQAALLAHEDNDRQFRLTSFKLKQLKRIFDVRGITDQMIADRLSSVGIIAESRERVLSEWKAERDADELVDAARTRQPTKADIKNWLEKGVIDTVEWARRMVGLGYSTEDSINYLAEIVSDAGNS